MVRSHIFNGPNSQRAWRAIVGGGILMVLLAGALPAGAEQELTVAPGRVVKGKRGTVKRVLTEPVPPEIIGLPCDLKVVSKNGGSVHPGNEAVIETGDYTIYVPDIEAKSNKIVEHVERVIMGEEVVVGVKFGRDGISSMGFTVKVKCPPKDIVPAPEPVLPEPEPETTTTAVPESTTTVPESTTTVPETTTAVLESTTTVPETTTTTVPEPEVKPGRQLLPESPPAVAVPADPTFTG